MMIREQQLPLPSPQPHPSPKPKKPLPFPPPQQLQRRSSMIIQLHPLSLEPPHPLHPPQFVAAKSLIKSSILSSYTTVKFIYNS